MNEDDGKLGPKWIMITVGIVVVVCGLIGLSMLSSGRSLEGTTTTTVFFWLPIALVALIAFVMIVVIIGRKLLSWVRQQAPP